MALVTQAFIKPASARPVVVVVVDVVVVLTLRLSTPTEAKCVQRCQAILAGAFCVLATVGCSHASSWNSWLARPTWSNPPVWLREMITDCVSINTTSDHNSFRHLHTSSKPNMHSRLIVYDLPGSRPELKLTDSLVSNCSEQ